MPSHPERSAPEIRSRQRIAAAFAALTEPDGDRSGTTVHLDDGERQTIAAAVAQSSHPLAGFARTVLDEWDDLELDDQVAGLLLFAEITNQTSRQRKQQIGVQR